MEEDRLTKKRGVHMPREMRGRNVAAAAVAGGILIGAIGLIGQPRGETFTATATVKSPTAAASAAVTITIDRYVSDAERQKLMAVVKRNDPAATREALAAMDDIGFIGLGARRTPIKFAYVRPMGGGRLITVVTAQPVLYLGGNIPDAKPKEGFDLALALLVLDARDTGDGEFAPAAKVKVDESGAIVTDEYGSEVVRLTGISKAKTPVGTSGR
jgi:hypothetical protein